MDIVERLKQTTERNK